MFRVRTKLEMFIARRVKTHHALRANNFRDFGTGCISHRCCWWRYDQRRGCYRSGSDVGVRITATPGSVLILTPATSGRVGHPSYGRRGTAIGSKREDM